MQLVYRHPFESRHVPARNVDIWLPPDYAQDSERKYPVIYMHDGQNLFDPALSFSGVDWGVDPALRGLIETGEIEAPIVVGIWNTDNRLGEYMPEQSVQDPAARTEVDQYINQFRSEFEFNLASDAYLALVVEELKPWVDAEYRTRAGQADTHMIGSSMGALISLYAICRYPEVFCGAACLSTAWHFGQEVHIPWFGSHLPDPATHKVYFDMGGREDVWPKANHTLLKKQAEMDELVRAAGYCDGESLLTLVFPEGKHHETYWRARLDRPLKFLLGTN